MANISITCIIIYTPKYGISQLSMHVSVTHCIHVYTYSGVGMGGGGAGGLFCTVHHYTRVRVHNYNWCPAHLKASCYITDIC